jgi:hypothetical protein
MFISLYQFIGQIVPVMNFFMLYPKTTGRYPLIIVKSILNFLTALTA